MSSSTKEVISSNSLLEQVNSLRCPPGTSSPPTSTHADTRDTSSSGAIRPALYSRTSGNSEHTLRHGSFPNQKTRASPVTSQAGNRLPSLGSTPDEARRTPKERLNAYLASSSTRQTPTAQAEAPPRPKPDRAASEMSVESSRSASSTPPTMAPFAPSISSVRDQSLDSTISSHTDLSGPTGTSSIKPNQSPRTSSESWRPNDDDVHSTIARSGTSEAAIKQLLKDNKSLVTRSEQMWTLVQKQRELILGLKKDLDTSNTERDRYRHKLKAQVAANSSLQSEGRSENRPTDKPVDAGMDPGAKRTHNASIDAVDSISDQLMAREVGAKIAPTTSDLQDRDPGVSNGANPVDRRKPQAVPAPLGLRRDLVTQDPSSPNSTQSPKQNPISPSMISPGTPGGEGKRKPTPLKLGQLHSPTTSQEAQPQPQAQQQDRGRPSEQSDGENRGRRRTRADDDRERETSYAEEERRSRSMKKSKSKNKTPTDEQEPIQSVPEEASTSLANGVGLPSSPRAPLLGGLQSPPFQPSLGSIAGMMTTSTLQSTLNNSHMLPSLKSPGLPMSPRPGDRPMNAAVPRNIVQHTIAPPLMSPGPMSARGFILSPRPPRQPIPLPDDLQPDLPKPQSSRGVTQSLEQPSLGERMQTRHAYAASKDTVGSHNAMAPVYHGFMSDDYPELLLPPNALSRVFVSVYSSRLRPSRNSLNASKEADEDQVFTLAVHSKADHKQLWRLEKTIDGLFSFDSTLRRSSSFNARLPDKSLFAGHAPLKVDQRRSALNEYFGVLLSFQYSESAALAVCSFLGSEAIGPNLASDPLAGRDSFEHRIRKEGYLAKKGRHMTGWKARYFVLDGKDLQYYETPGGEHLGRIRLHKAQIGPQRADSSSEDSEYRHGLMVLELKRDESSSLVRHVLCAESDEERDDWINALQTYVEGLQVPPSPSPATGSGSPQQSQARFQRSPPSTSALQARSKELQSVGYDQTVAAGAPVMGSPTESNESGSPIDREVGVPSIYGSADRPAISGPVAGGPIQNLSAWGNKAAPPKEKRNIFGFKLRTSEDNANTQARTPGPTQQTFRQVSGRPIFGLHLAEAAELFPPRGVDICLPSPIYRCIEYLEAKQASRQEGLFRVSGSQTVIQALKQRFNSESDVDLLRDEHEYEIMAVADLLRLYCRELPEPILTRQLLLDFHKVLEVKNQREKIEAYNILVHRLPEANFELLATISRYLLSVVANAAENKMHERNLATIWSSSFNVPFPLMVLFITEHEAIFGDAMDEASSPVVQSLANSSNGDSSGMSMSDLRSPRKQMFTDLATPGPTQTSFQQDQQAYGRTQPLNTPQAYGLSSMNASAAPQQNYRPYAPIQPPGADQGFGSLNAALAPSPAGSPAASPLRNTELSKELKKARRESGLKNLISPPMSPSLDGKRKSSMPRIREMAGFKDDR